MMRRLDDWRCGQAVGDGHGGLLPAAAVLVVLGLVLYMGGVAWGYEQAAPPSIRVELTYRPAGGGSGSSERVTLVGDLVFESLPVVIDGKRSAFGMKDLVPKRPGEIWLRRVAGAGGDVFTLHEYRGEHRVTLGFDRIPIVLSDAGRIDESLRAGLEPAAVVEGDEADALLEGGSEGGVDGAVEAGGGGPVNAGLDSQTPVRLALSQRSGVDAVLVGELESIVFNLPESYRREKPRGRFVSYSKAAVGSGGRVQVASATFLGGEGDESFTAGAFLPGGGIAAVGSFDDASFVRGVKVRVLGDDPPADAFAQESAGEGDGGGGRGRSAGNPRLTPMVVRFDGELTRVEDAVRLPWGAGRVSQMLVAGDGGVVLAGVVGANGEGGFAGAGRRSTVANPGRVAWAAERGREPGADGFVMRLSPGLDRIEWCVRFAHSSIRAALRPDGSVLAQRGRTEFFVIDGGGAVSPGPVLDEQVGGRAFAPLVVDSRDGSMYLGGEYHSGTGREPYRNPFLHKFDVEGRCQWTAWNWTGAIVGVDQSRLVSDSAVQRVKVGRRGDLIVRGWSDGGNSVFTKQPYDLHDEARTYGFASSIWGAGVLSVSYLIRMDAETMDVSGYTRWLAYLPLDDLPNGASIRDFLELEDGGIAFTGGTAYGLIETHDAWVSPWWVRQQTDEFARARGGSYFAIYSPDFRSLWFSSVLPGVGGQTLAQRGRHVLVTGYAGARHTSYGADIATLTKRAVQPGFGGGERDAYIMLVDTQGERPGVGSE